MTLPDLSLAISVGQLVLVGFLTVTGSRFMFDTRASIRREMISLDGIRAIDSALSEQNYELAVGALLEWEQTYRHELDMQLANPWSPVRFWKFPPSYGKDWK